MRIKPTELRPGMHVWPHRLTEPAVLELDAMQVTKVAMLLGGMVEWETRWSGPSHLPGDSGVITVATTPPRVLMSWDEDSGYWAILIDTTNGSGHSKLNIALNDAELWDGPSDPEEEPPEPRLVSAGSFGGEVDAPPGEPCPDCGAPRGYHALDCPTRPNGAPATEWAPMHPDDAAYAREVAERQARIEEAE